MQEYGVIYKITNDVTGKVYIGQTTQGFNNRYGMRGKGAERVYNYHKALQRCGRPYNEHLLNSFEKYGIENFSVEERYDVAFSKEELDRLEIEYIKQFKSDIDGYNRDSGGHHAYPNAEAKEKMRRIGEENHFYGRHHTEETRKYLSAVKAGKYTGADNPNYGRRWSEEQRKALSEKMKGKPGRNKGRKMSEAARLKNKETHKDIWKRLKHPMLGFHWSEEHKKAQSERMMGVYVGDKNPNAKAVVCVTTGETFTTINEGAKKYNTCPSGISTCLKGKRHSAGKLNGVPLVWRYAAEA